MRSFLLAVVALAAVPQPVFAWGKTGHRVVGAIAEPYLSPAARAGVKRLLGVETLAEAANWADFVRSDPDPRWAAFTPWHYVTVPAETPYAAVGAPAAGDAVTALARFSAELRDPKTPVEERRTALRFIVHIVGDLHQPLHAGRPGDSGGNAVRVTFMGRPTNLHSVWDSGLVDDEQLSFTEMSAWLGARITPVEARAWATTDPAAWIAESVALRETIYPQPGETALSYAYVYRTKAPMERRLEQAGVRLAAVLNDLFAPRRRARRS